MDQPGGRANLAVCVGFWAQFARGSPQGPGGGVKIQGISRQVWGARALTGWCWFLVASLYWGGGGGCRSAHKIQRHRKCPCPSSDDVLAGPILPYHSANIFDSATHVLAPSS